MKIYLNHFICLSLFLFSAGSLAAGMVPQNPIVMIEESDGEGNIDIKNTDKYPSLLITKIENLEDDKEELITVYPPVARVEGNETQTVRFLITTKTPLKTERLKRVTFEGVPPKNGDLEKEINVTFKQNLPVIIRPAGLAQNLAPWEGLTWEYKNNQFTVTNPSPYVVRFISPNITVLPSGQRFILPKTYILPHQSFDLSGDQNTNIKNADKVRFYPATTWGFSTNKYYDAPLID
ncbi:MAG: fimbria/pilus periplasmic chaperone [Providencia sp.]|jgi:P pilus assembly chaperone PapD|nr:fimbria/pilus periplasmic chaperone [Providencia sp.]